jgi:hypothetical protein
LKPGLRVFALIKTFRFHTKLRAKAALYPQLAARREVQGHDLTRYGYLSDDNPMRTAAQPTAGGALQAEI